ncbi:hypothetical protein OG345_13705 [Streptomyces sp. NBC_01220]|uniref:hypothetical protein n=1 Tax=unclassified Streptomyces TaxID=2593676 RepID=UPI0034359BE8|nr:hypothetical protein OG345_13705 [Streptomyces sp. NBC_01220]
MNYAVLAVGLRGAPTVCDPMNAVDVAEIGLAEFDLHIDEAFLEPAWCLITHRQIDSWC